MIVAYHLSTSHDGGASLSAFSNGKTSEFADFAFKLFFTLSAKREAVNTNLLKSFVWPDPESNSRSNTSREDASFYSADSRSSNDKELYNDFIRFNKA